MRAGSSSSPRSSGRKDERVRRRLEALVSTDPEVADAIASELRRERTTIRLVASENYASPRSSRRSPPMNNKYAEGYPGRRYYGGCANVDVVRRLSSGRRLFGAEHAEQQPHAGAQANLAVLGAFCQPRSGDTVLGLVLSHGGHLTHGSPVASPGWFRFVNYEVDRGTEMLDMDRIRDLALEHRPRILLAGFTAYLASSTSRPSVASRTRSARCCGSMPLTSSVSWRGARTRAPCRTRTS